MTASSKPIEIVAFPAPPADVRAQRAAAFAPPGEKRTRYTLPSELKSSSPVAYRKRVPMTADQLADALQLLSLERPRRFDPPSPTTEQELFEECSLGVLSARQSTNYRGHKQLTFGPRASAEIAGFLCELDGLEAPVLNSACMTHVVLSRPYRTPFTTLLTFIGHWPVLSLLTVPLRWYRKRYHHATDIPTIGYLQHLHVGILADAMERAAVLASDGRRRAQVLQGPFCGTEQPPEKMWAMERLYALCGVTEAERAEGWRIALVAQVGNAIESERVSISRETCRLVAANLLALRSERIQPGVNQESTAPPAYHQRQEYDVPEELVVQAGRAAYNAFAHWTGADRERGKELLLLERVDVLTPGGKTRLRTIREHLDHVTDRVVRNLPKWIDWPTGFALSRNAKRGKKAFALAGQRIYLLGLAKQEIAAEDICWNLAVRAVGAVASRAGLVAELHGVLDLPEDCDLLAGVCLMAGPVNQNDVGKAFYGAEDLLVPAFPDRDPTTLLVWTLKAKTVADPIGNEEQLLNAEKKGALVDLRAGPHEVVQVHLDGKLTPMRQRALAAHGAAETNQERAFADVGNFITDPSGADIPGNRGAPWPESLARAVLWPTDTAAD